MAGIFLFFAIRVLTDFSFTIKKQVFIILIFSSYFRSMQKVLLLLLFFDVFKVSAQKIEGTVKDTEGNVLPFASILVKGTPMGTTTNDQGRFSISLPPGDYTIDCRYVGYASEEKKITLKASDETISFELHLQTLRLKEVIVKPGGEDPAYEIIRKAIKKRPYYESEVKSFEAKAVFNEIPRNNRHKNIENFHFMLTSLNSLLICLHIHGKEVLINTFYCKIILLLFSKIEDIIGGSFSN